MLCKVAARATKPQATITAQNPQAATGQAARLEKNAFMDGPLHQTDLYLDGSEAVAFPSGLFPKILLLWRRGDRTGARSGRGWLPVQLTGDRRIRNRHRPGGGDARAAMFDDRVFHHDFAGRDRRIRVQPCARKRRECVNSGGKPWCWCRVRRWKDQLRWSFLPKITQFSIRTYSRGKTLPRRRSAAGAIEGQIAQRDHVVWTGMHDDTRRAHHQNTGQRLALPYSRIGLVIVTAPKPPGSITSIRRRWRFC